jgi:sec-independent protein translocase protein TatA
MINIILAPLGLGPMEVILIVLVVILLFGGRKIPELMRGIGQGMKEFKKAAREDDPPANRTNTTIGDKEIK